MIGFPQSRLIEPIQNHQLYAKSRGQSINGKSGAETDLSRKRVAARRSGKESVNVIFPAQKTPKIKLIK